MRHLWAPFAVAVTIYAVYMLSLDFAALEDANKALKTRVSNLSAANQSLVDELSWCKDQISDIFGPGFNKGNLRSVEVVATSYNPTEDQCDSSPLIAADGHMVMPGVLALPKHYRLSLGLTLGQVVWLSKDGMQLGWFTIRDHMNSRKPWGRVDIISFIPGWSKKFGRVKGLKMHWIANGGDGPQM